MNSATSNCEHVLNFWIFYYHLQLFKQRNLINYQQRDSGSNRKTATVEFISFFTTVQKNLVKMILPITCGKAGNFLGFSHCTATGYCRG